jgi:protein SCO1/2
MLWMIDNRLLSWYSIAAAILFTLLLQPCHLCAHSQEYSAERISGLATPQQEGSGIGVNERLGAKIPLDSIFRDETGKMVRLSELITGPTIVLPVYYSCTNVCNILQGGMASTLPAVKRKPGGEYRVLSISFDETETPAIAARYKRMYLASMNAPFPADGWRFLTGDAQNIRRLTDAAGYRFQRKGREFVHPVASFVVTRDGMIVRYLYGTNFLPKDLTLALLEAQSGTVGATIRTVVSYCFSFDPAGKAYVFRLLRVSATIVILTAGGFLVYLLLAGRSLRHGSRRNP